MSRSNLAAFLVAAIYAFLILWSHPAHPQNSLEPTNHQRLTQSMNQLAGALSIKRGNRVEPACASVTYKEIPVEEYMESVDDLEFRSSGKRAGQSQKNELRGIIYKMLEGDIPNQGPFWRVTYHGVQKSVISMYPTLKEKELCDALDSMANGLFQKAKDNLKLVVKK